MIREIIAVLIQSFAKAMLQRSGKRRLAAIMLWSQTIALSALAVDQQSCGVPYFNSGNYTKALKCFEDDLRAGPNDWKTLQSIASCHNRLGEFDQAIRCAQKSIEIGGLNAGQCVIIAGSMEGLGEPRKALAWMKLACSVDPSQRSNPGIQSILRRLQDPEICPNASPDEPDYLDGLVSVSKWRPKDLPLRIFVRKNSQIADFHQAFSAVALEALDQWCTASEKVIWYKVVDDLKSANIVFDYTDRRELVSSSHEPGLDGDTATAIRAQDNTTDHAVITVLVKDNPRAPFRNRIIVLKTLLHEVGHALGMHGHSINRHDAMFFASTPEPAARLSERDKKTIRKIYHP